MEDGLSEATRTPPAVMARVGAALEDLDTFVDLRADNVGPTTLFWMRGVNETRLKFTQIYAAAAGEQEERDKGSVRLAKRVNIPYPFSVLTQGNSPMFGTLLTLEQSS